MKVETEQLTLINIFLDPSDLVDLTEKNSITVRKSISTSAVEYKGQELECNIIVSLKKGIDT